MVGAPWRPQNKVMMLEIHYIVLRHCDVAVEKMFFHTWLHDVTCNIMQPSMPHPHIAETHVINGIIPQELQGSPRRTVTNPDAFADPQVWSSSQ